MEYLMRIPFKTVLGIALLSLLLGCGASRKEQKKEAKAMPERSAEVIFKNMTAVQVKNNLMSACSQSRLRILPDQAEVLCIRTQLSNDREKMLVTLVNDDFARNVTDNVKFVMTPEGKDVRVIGNAYLQFASPLGIEGGAGVKTIKINLLDNASFSMLEALLKQAGATQP
jgi:hypothetical protein